MTVAEVPWNLPSNSGDIHLSAVSTTEGAVERRRARRVPKSLSAVTTIRLSVAA
jgi:hypothetical protein